MRPAGLKKPYSKMLPEEVYEIKNFLPRELLRRVAFDISRGFLQENLKFPKFVRAIEIEEYESHYITCGPYCWWVTIENEILQSILMFDNNTMGCFSAKTSGFCHVYLK